MPNYEGLLAETLTYPGANGDIINAYMARPLGHGPYPGVIVIHHMPGWDEATKEITRRFAHHGYVAVMLNLPGRLLTLLQTMRRLFHDRQGEFPTIGLLETQKVLLRI